MTTDTGLVLTAGDLSVADIAAAGMGKDRALAVPAGLTGFVLYGPYRDMPDGIYEFTVSAKSEEPDVGSIDIYSHGDTFFAGPLRDGVPFEVRLKDAAAMEVRVRATGKAFVFRSVKIERVGDLPDTAKLPDTLVLAEARNRMFQLRGQADKASVAPWPQLGGAEAPATVWSALHSGCQREALGPLAHDLKTADIDAWIGDTAGAAVVEAWGEVGIHSERQLAAQGFIPSSARLMAHEDLALEALYASCRGDVDLDAHLRRIAAKEFGRHIRSAYLAKLSEMQSAFQKTGLSRGAVYCPCPISGQLLRSSHAIPVPFDLGKQTFLFYYFKGVEPFYVAAGGWSGAKIFAYFPQREVILRLQDPLYNWGPPQDAVNVFKRLMVTHAALVHDYLTTPTVPALLSGTIENLGHFFWNDVAGLVSAEREGLLENVNHAVSYRHAFLDPFSVLAKSESLVRFSCKTETELFTLILKEHLFCVRATALTIDDDTAARLHGLAQANLSVEHRALLAKAQAAPYRLWANLRAHNKVLRNQVEAIVKVAEDTARRHGGLALYLDGTPDCAAMADEISAQVSSAVTVHRGLDVSMSDSICWAFAVDSYIATIGSGLTLVTWLAKKPGVAHSERAHLAQMEFWGEVRTGAPMPVTPTTSEINDLGEGGYCDYLIDPTLLVSLMRRATSGDALPNLPGLKGLRAMD